MDSEIKKGPKKIEISSSSLVALKAELLSKQAQVRKTKAEGFNTIRSRPAKLKSTVKKNSGVEERAKRDETQKKEDEPSLEKSRIMLEEKAKLYERLCADKALLDEDTISEDQSVFLVNFQQKLVENTLRQRQTKPTDSRSRRDSSPDDTIGTEEDYTTTNPEEEWVDYIDSFGRTRRCLKKDLPSFQQQDAELSKQPQSTPVSYGNFVKSNEHTGNEGDSQNILSQDEESRKRQRELWEEEEERNRQKTNVHYQDVLFQEARQHGAGFYSFSKDEEERAKQMEELASIRKQTELAREQSARTATDKQLALEARLKKVRDRKRQKLGLPPLKSQPKVEITPTVLPTPLATATTPSTDSDKDAEENLRKTIARSLPQTVKVRPWDLGKEGVPKQPVMTQNTWVEKKREERKQEFAPPTIYKESDASRPKVFVQKHQEPVILPGPVISEDSIVSGLAFLKQMATSRSATLPEPCKIPDEEIEENDDGLLPPGESDVPQTVDVSSRWRSVPSRGVEVAPPTNMDYYTNSSSSKTRHRGVSSQRTDVSESFSVGIKQRKNVIGDNPSTAKEEPPSKWNLS